MYQDMMMLTPEFFLDLKMARIPVELSKLSNHLRPPRKRETGVSENPGPDVCLPVMTCESLPKVHLRRSLVFGNAPQPRQVGQQHTTQH